MHLHFLRLLQRRCAYLHLWCYTGTFKYQKFCALFVRFSLQEMTVSDYGTAFTRAEFKRYVEKNGTRHITTVPYHAASNGFVWHAVQMVKRSLLKQTPGDIDTRLSQFILNYRSTPSEVTLLNLISSNRTFKPEYRKGNAI